MSKYSRRFQRILHLVLFSMLSLLLCACHGSKQRGNFTIPEEFDSTQKIEITFWAKNDTNVVQKATYKKAIEDFQALYPNVTVNLRLYTDYSRLYNDVITNIQTNTTPNVCITYPDHIATYMTGEDVVITLDDLMENEVYGLGGSGLLFDGPTAEEIVPKFLSECQIGDHYYALPFMRSTEACYVNKNLVEKLGYTLPDVLTWDFIWEVSEAAMEKTEDGKFAVNGQKVMIPFIYKSTDNMMIQMLRQLNAGYSDSDGSILIFNDTTKELLTRISTHAKTRAFSTFKISSYPGNFLNAGQCIFAIDSTAGATWMGSGAPLSDIDPKNVVEFETVVYPVPQFDTQNPQMISQGPSACIFNKENPQEVLASWLFLQFLLTNEVQITYAETEGYVPVTTKAQEDPAYVDYLSRSGENNNEYYAVKIAATKLLLDNIENTFVTPVFNGSASLRDAAGQLIENVTLSVRRKEEITPEYFTKLFDDVSSLYRLDQIHVSDESTDLGELPTEAVVLLTSLAVIWGCILLYGCVEFIKNKKTPKKNH